MKKKVALICPGGGMRCAYTSGALTALSRELKFTSPDIAIAASGGTSSLFYYLADQCGDMESMWIKPKGLEKFVSLWRREILDTHFLVKEIFEKKYPLNTQKIDAYPGTYFIPVTRVSDGSTKYFSNKQIDIFQLILASIAIPIFTKACVVINGEAYFDGEIGLTLEDLIAKARKEGAEKIIVVWPYRSAIETAWKRFPLGLYALLRRRNLRYALRREYDKIPTEEDFKHAAGDAELFIVRPEGKLPAHLITFSASPLRSTFQTGYRDVYKNDKLRAIVKDDGVITE